MHNDLYENTSQKHSKRRSWHIMPNKVSLNDEIIIFPFFLHVLIEHP